MLRYSDGPPGRPDPQPGCLPSATARIELALCLVRFQAALAKAALRASPPACGRAQPRFLGNVSDPWPPLLDFGHV